MAINSYRRRQIPEIFPLYAQPQDYNPTPVEVITLWSLRILNGQGFRRCCIEGVNTWTNLLTQQFLKLAK